MLLSSRHDHPVQTSSSTQPGTFGFFSHCSFHLPSHPSALAGIANTAVANHVLDPALRSAYIVGSRVRGSIILLLASTLQMPPFLPLPWSSSAVPETPARDTTTAPSPVALVPSLGDSLERAVSCRPSLCRI